ncbi:hypothetical protein N836_35295 [Leptolyngbya sp. Heron Island J]|nr:hypothetical protein N836_35295 [Leptolyngbya sp. Heron Island J]
MFERADVKKALKDNRKGLDSPIRIAWILFSQNMTQVISFMH